jgi:hypothetical protein
MRTASAVGVVLCRHRCLRKQDSEFERFVPVWPQKVTHTVTALTAALYPYIWLAHMRWILLFCTHILVTVSQAP